MTNESNGMRLDDEEVRRDVEAYWRVHEREADAVREVVVGELRQEPGLSAVVDAMEHDQHGPEQLNVLMRQAIDDGDWGPYRAQLREQGVAYARLGLTFAQWFQLTTAFRRYIVPHLIDTYGQDPDQLARAVRGKGTVFDVALQTIGEAYLDEREQTIDKQRAAIAELSTPVLQIRPGLLLMPVVGVVDSGRSAQLTEALLYTIRDTRARVVVMDITGVPEVDSEVANRLIQAAEAARLMGATPIMTGISSGVAQTLVTLGVDLKGLSTVGDLQGGIEEADDLLGIRIVWDRPPLQER